MTDNTKKVVKTKETLEQDAIDFIYTMCNGIKNLFWIAVFCILYFFIYMIFSVK